MVPHAVPWTWSYTRVLCKHTVPHRLVWVSSLFVSMTSLFWAAILLWLGISLRNRTKWLLEGRLPGMLSSTPQENNISTYISSNCQLKDLWIKYNHLPTNCEFCLWLFIKLFLGWESIGPVGAGVCWTLYYVYEGWIAIFLLHSCPCAKSKICAGTIYTTGMLLYYI